MRRGFLHIIVVLFSLVLFVGCSSCGDHTIGTHPTDIYNGKAHTWQYRNLDSAAHYATKAFVEAGHYIHGRSVACNMLGFVSFMRMNYDEALYWYDHVDKLAGCELERLIADVGRMNVYQRVADNLAFYDCRTRALKRLAHINEEAFTFTSAEQKRLRTAVNGLHMISALHHYMIGQRPEAHAEMRKVIDDELLHADSAQWLMYTYIKGMGLDTGGETREQHRLHRYTYLYNCLRMSKTRGYTYFEGLSSSGLSELMADSVRMAYFAQYRPESFAQLVGSVNSSSNISMELVQRALQCLDAYGDRYGVMNATVQIASLHNRMGEYEQALNILEAITDGPPDPLARCYEEMSVAYAGMSNKAASDHYRNLYLDLLETTRQDKEMESRYLSLQRRSRTMKVLLYVAIVGIVLFVVLLTIVSRRRRRRGKGYEQQLHDLLQEAEKRVYIHQKHIAEGKRENIVRKASFSMVTGMMPYIDRMAHEVERLQSADVWDDESLRTRKLDYIAELADEINRLNELLSRWIKTSQGMVGLTIESFALADVFGMIERGSSSFMLRGITFVVQPTDAFVKADKALTFFMLNTLADNARKFTPEGGQVVVSATVCDEYVELSVTDNGVGMCDEDIARIVNEKVYDSTSIGKTLSPDWREKKGSGFGLLNCKGIIDKYRKTDAFFEVCRLGVDSQEGRGSRFWFRLPKGTRRMLSVLGVMMLTSLGALAATPSSVSAHDAIVVDTAILDVEVSDMLPSNESYSPLLYRASTFADSVYYANVEGRYHDALIYADSAIHYLNVHHLTHAEAFIDTLLASGGDPDVETRWWLSDYATDYFTILDVRNELAVANLALRRLPEYRYNNHIYNDLYKLVSEDRSLIDYCNRMQRYYSNTTVAVLICLLLVVGYLVVIIYTFMGRVADAYRNIESVEDDERRARHEENSLHVQNMVLDNCLSTLKHETVYYPNRIKQLVRHLGNSDERKQMHELISYYRVTFATLAGCASRQLEEVTFRRSTVPVGDILHRAVAYYTKLVTPHVESLTLNVVPCEGTVLCDEILVDFLMEQLIDASLSHSVSDKLQITVMPEGDFMRIGLTNYSHALDKDTLHTLFYPSHSRIVDAEGHLQGTEYIVCRQIIREHDEHFNHIGCRIKAEPAEGGYTVWFTLPKGAI